MNAPGADRIGLHIRLAAGTVAAVTVDNRRTLSLVSRFAGKPAADVAEAMALLHAVCGQSHAAAMRFAAAAARGEPVSDACRLIWARRLAGERIAEHLRSLADKDHPDLADLREALAAAHSIARGGPLAGLDRIAAVTSLPPSLPPASSADPLLPADDAAVISRLDAGFARLPVLPGRHPEVGPAARLGLSAATSGATAAARRHELAEALDLFTRGESAALDWLDTALVANGSDLHKGYAAVESPRGRLYYLLEVQGDGRLLNARALAPTEWNFHPAGPLVRALTGYRPAGDARAEVTRIAADFSPCVAFEVEVVDAADA